MESELPEKPNFIKEETKFVKIIDNTGIDEEKKDWKPEALVIGSGGSRGYMFLGALHRLYAEKILDEVQHYVGVSIGSVLAFLLALGFNPREIWSEVKNLNSKELAEMSSNMFKNLGLLNMEKIKIRIENFIQGRFSKDITFIELYEKTSKDLSVLAFNITTKRKTIFNRHLTPNDPIITILCMSCSIPFLFEPYKYKGMEYNDGAMYDSYPISLVDNGTIKILGLYIDDEVDDNPVSKINAILTGMLDGKRNDSIEKASDQCKHICIYSNFLDTTGISLDVNKKVILMASGDTSATLWLQDQRLTEKEKEKPTYTYLKAVADYGESLFEESDEEREVQAVNTEAFYMKEEKYNEDFLN